MSKTVLEGFLAVMSKIVLEELLAVMSKTVLEVTPYNCQLVVAQAIVLVFVVDEIPDKLPVEVNIV
jgi:hypothetical protein